MTVRTIKIAVYADLLSPWTYIAALELRRALARCAYLPVRFELEYRPFRVERLEDLPEGGVRVDRKAYYTGRYGRAGAEGRDRLVCERARRMGVKLNLDGELAQATRAHRLLALAYSKRGAGCQGRVLERLLSHVYGSGGCVDDTSALVRVAVDLRLFANEDDALAFLLSDQGSDELERAYADARALGISAVPCAVVGQWAVTGGQAADVYARIFRRLAESGQTTYRVSLPLVSATA